MILSPHVAVALDVATMLEVLSPLIPGYFILVAGAANVGNKASIIIYSSVPTATILEVLLDSA